MWLDRLERIDDFLEDVRVKWMLMDAQQKQVILLTALYLGYTILDVVGALAKGRAAKGAK